MRTKGISELVEDFHAATGAPINRRLTDAEYNLRCRLIGEEWAEFSEEIGSLDLGDPGEALLKEACDLVYVIVGTMVALGYDFDEAFRRVHYSNMSKMGEDGKPVKREDGKVIKGPNYKLADLTSCLPTNTISNEE